VTSLPTTFCGELQKELRHQRLQKKDRLKAVLHPCELAGSFTPERTMRPTPVLRDMTLPPAQKPLYTFTRCNRKAFSTTETELNAIAAPATHGARKPAAAIGMPSEL